MSNPKKILLVDDDPAAVYITKNLLKRAAIEVEVLTASNGLEALQMVRHVCQQEQCPELILLDINMPVMDGFEFLDHLQESADLSTEEIKIVLVSSSRHYLDLVRVQNYPVIDCLEKPLTPEKLARFL